MEEQATSEIPQTQPAQDIRALNERIEKESAFIDLLKIEMEKSIVGQKEMVEKLKADGRATGVAAVTHGNAWSVYFKDPEENTLEVFCDSPFHVRQPQAQTWDFSMNEEELRRYTEGQFSKEPEFGPIEEFYAEHRRRHGD